jgi:hypothetical protein
MNAVPLLSARPTDLRRYSKADCQRIAACSVSLDLCFMGPFRSSSQIYTGQRLITAFRVDLAPCAQLGRAKGGLLEPHPGK